MRAAFHYRGGCLPLERTAVMGILNITPDSFSDGGRFLSPDDALARAVAIEAEGASILDIGGQSTRPDATRVSPETEWARLAPVLTALQGAVSVPLSIDTFEPFVARHALAHGAHILNDVSGSMTNDFPAIAADSGAGLIMMARDAETVDDIRRYFDKALHVAVQAGLPLDRVCLDIGIGFHRSRDIDLQAIAALPTITSELPTAVLVGASRKRVVAFASQNEPPENRLFGTIALHTAAQLGGAHILRVHDVAAAVQAAAVTDRLKFTKGDDSYDRLETF